MKTRQAKIYRRVSCAALSAFAFLGLTGCYLLPQEEQEDPPSLPYQTDRIPSHPFHDSTVRIQEASLLRKEPDPHHVLR